MNKNAEIEGNTCNRNRVLQYIIIKYTRRLKTGFNGILPGFMRISGKLNQLRIYYIKSKEHQQQCLRTI